MSTRLAALAAGTLLAALLAGCTGMTRMSAEPPPALSLSGTWTLDALHSTDSDKALAGLLRAAHRGRRTAGYGEGVHRHVTAGGASASGSTGDDALLALGAATDMYPPNIDLQKELLAGGDWLRIEQRPGELIITNAAASHAYVPGQRSVVSVPSGVADQRSGWKGREYWIELKPQVGPSATEKFKLSADGKELIETIEVGGEGRVPRLEVTRVYLPSSNVPAAPVPSDD